jgi:gliding motility-associated transport system ATP-binding protein
MPVITVEGLSKYYGSQAAIRDLSFEIERGQVVGFLGLNGAGKSTTLKVLGCVLLPTSGHVEIDGYDVMRDPHEIRKRIGFLPDTPPLYNEMRVGDYLAFVAQLRGVQPSQTAARVKVAEEQTALRDHHDEVIGTLSHGYRQRVGLAQALVHNPQLLILDEPTSGLDPVQIVEMRQLIRGLRGQHTVLLSSHNLGEISQTCDRLLIIHEGRMVAQETEAQLAAKLGSGAVEVEVVGKAARAVQALKAVEGVKSVSVVEDADNARLQVEAASSLRPELVKALVKADVGVLSMAEAKGGLEQIFLKLTQTQRN